MFFRKRYDAEKLASAFDRVERGIQSGYLRGPWLGARDAIECFPNRLHAKLNPIGEVVLKIRSQAKAIGVATKDCNERSQLAFSKLADDEIFNLPHEDNSEFVKGIERVVNEQRAVAQQLFELRSIFMDILNDREEVLTSIMRGTRKHKFRDLPNAVVEELAGSVFGISGLILKIIQVALRKREDFSIQFANSASKLDRLFLAAEYFQQLDEKLDEPIDSMLESLDAMFEFNEKYLAYLLGEMSEAPWPLVIRE